MFECIQEIYMILPYKVFHYHFLFEIVKQKTKALPYVCLTCDAIHIYIYSVVWQTHCMVRLFLHTTILSSPLQMEATVPKVNMYCLLNIYTHYYLFWHFLQLFWIKLKGDFPRVKSAAPLTGIELATLRLQSRAQCHRATFNHNCNILTFL